MSEPDNFVEFPANAVIFREGDAGAEMFIIETGGVDILRNNRIDDPIANLGPGDFFGEMAILEDQPRFATVRTTADTRLMRIDRSAFANLISSNVEVSIRIMRKLTGRLRRAELRIQELGEIIDTRRMTASLLDDRRTTLIVLLDQWLANARTQVSR